MLLVVDDLAVPDPNQPVVAVDLETSQFVPFHEGVDHSLKAAVRTESLNLVEKFRDNTVYIEFCDQPPSEGSGSLNPKNVVIR